MKTSAMIKELKGKIPQERIGELKKMDEQFLQRIFSMDATIYANQRILEALKGIDKTRAVEFLSHVREKYFDRKIDGNRAFEASYVDDVEAIIAKCLEVLRAEIDQSPYMASTKKIKDSDRIDALDREQKLPKRLILSSAETRDGYILKLVDMARKLEPYLKDENSESLDKKRSEIIDDLLGLFLTPEPYESFQALVHSKAKPDIDTVKLQEELEKWKYFWEEEIDSQRWSKDSNDREKTPEKYRVLIHRESYLRANFQMQAFQIIEKAIADFSFSAIAAPETIEALRTEDLQERAYTEEKYEKRTDIRYLIKLIEGVSIPDEDRRELLCFYGAKNNDVISSYIAQTLGVSDEIAVGLLKQINVRIQEDPVKKGQIRAFEFASMDHAMESMSMVIQKKRMELLFGDDIQKADSDGFFLYRAGPFDEQSESIKARELESRKTIATHVGYGSSSPEYMTPFLSTTMDPYIAATYMYAQSVKTPDQTALESKRAPVMVIDCKALYEVIGKRAEYLRTVDSKHMPFEQILLGELLEVVDTPEYRKKIEERQSEISGKKEYRPDPNLSTMIHPTFIKAVNDAEFATLGDLIDQSAAYSIKEIGEDRRRKVKDFGKPSFEVTVKSAIPVRYTSPDDPQLTTQVTREIDPLQLDFIQVLEDLRPQNGGTPKMTKFIRNNQKNPMIERLGRIIDSAIADPESTVLSRAEAQFARMYYIERKPISTIMENFPNRGKEFEDAQFQIALSEQIREQILAKLIRDPEISTRLNDCGIQTYPRVKTQNLVGYGISRTVEDASKALRTDYMEHPAFSELTDQGENGQAQKVVLGYFDSKKRETRGKAERMAKRYLEAIGHLRDVEI